MARIIKLQSSDSLTVDMDWEAVACSQTLTTMLRDLGLEDSTETTTIPLPNIDGETLMVIVEWCTQHKGEEVKKDDDTKIMPQWDKEFLNVEDDFLYKIIVAANYLDIYYLLEYACAAVANTLDEEKTAENIAKRYKIECDLTEEQKDAIKKDNAWIEE